MKRPLLLIAALLLFPATASAQWNFSSVFPPDTLETNGNGFHGVAVDDDGTVFLQTFNTARDTIQYRGANRAVIGIQIFNPDGTEVDASPLLFIDYADGVTPRDTLGLFTVINSSGQPAADTRTGRGLRYCAAENAVYISQFDTIFKINADTYQGLAKIKPFGAGVSLGAVGVDANCNVTVQSVSAGSRNIIQFDPDLQSQIGVVGKASDFTRTVFASPDGNTVLETAFENPFAVVYRRADEFSAYDSLGVTLAGMRIESAEVNPSTGYWWFSAGNPLNKPNQYFEVDSATGDTTRFQTSWSTGTYYAFRPQDLFDTNGNPVLIPTPVDSLVYNDPGSVPNGGDGVGVGRPRGIAFTADGNTAYVTLYNKAGAAQVFTRSSTAGEEGPGTFAGALEQNAPNPFRDQTAIRFTLDAAATVSLKVYDATGREVAALADGPMRAGSHEVQFAPSGLAAGVYVYVLDVDGETTSRRMMIVR